MSLSMSHDVGAYIKGAASLLTTTADAEQSGVFIDREDFMSGVLMVAWEAVLADGETLTLAFNAQDNAANTADGNEADFGDAFASAVVATGGSGGSTERGVSELDLDLAPARQFVRAQATLTTSATGTVIGSAVFVLGGAVRLV